MKNKPNFNKDPYEPLYGLFSTKRLNKSFVTRLKSLVLFLLLLISSKPILTYLIYPVKDFRRVLAPGGDSFQRVLDGFEPLGYHINKIFIYENITFVYSIILAIIFILILDRFRQSQNN